MLKKQSLEKDMQTWNKQYFYKAFDLHYKYILDLGKLNK